MRVAHPFSLASTDPPILSFELFLIQKNEALFKLILCVAANRVRGEDAVNYARKSVSFVSFIRRTRRLYIQRFSVTKCSEYNVLNLVP